MYKINKECWLKNDKNCVISFGKWTTKKVVRICPKCKGEKEVSVYSITRRGNSYCNGCLRTLRTMKEVLGKRFGNAVVVDFSEPRIDSKGRKVLRAICSCSCGKSFVADVVNLKSGSILSCGCIRKDRLGPKNPNYKSFLTEEQRKNTKFMRSSANMQTWKKKVRDVFGNRCFLCGSEKQIEVHHVEGFKDNEELRYDVQNGVCLCREHHTLYHTQFLGGFHVLATKQSFKSFMEWWLCQLQNC